MALCSSGRGRNGEPPRHKGSSKPATVDQAIRGHWANGSIGSAFGGPFLELWRQVFLLRALPPVFAAAVELRPRARVRARRLACPPRRARCSLLSSSSPVRRRRYHCSRQEDWLFQKAGLIVPVVNFIVL
jgi:hypothetical protein